MLNSLLKILQWKSSLRIKPKGHTMVYTALHDLAPCYLCFSPGCVLIRPRTFLLSGLCTGFLGQKRSSSRLLQNQLPHFLQAFDSMPLSSETDSDHHVTNYNPALPLPPLQSGNPCPIFAFSHYTTF